MIDTVKENPIPSIIAGLSIGWLVARGSSSSSQRRYSEDYGYGSAYPRYGRGRYAEQPAYPYEEEYAPGAYQGAGYTEEESEEGHSVRERASEAAGRVRGTAQQYGHQAQHQAQRAASQAERMMDESPLAVGAATLALGAFAGLMLPRTHAEDRFMGEARDRTVHKGQEIAQETMERAKHVAQKTAEEAKETAKEETQKEKEKARSERKGS